MSAAAGAPTDAHALQAWMHFADTLLDVASFFRCY